MAEQQFKEIALSKIIPSPWNPRKTFKGADFDELVESIRQQGVIQPVLVRPIKGKGIPYELVFGERRLKASIEVSKDNGGPAKNTIPALIRELDDDQAFELTTIENLQREDLNELEEARGFQMFVKRKGEDALQELADRTGKNIQYIRRRLAVLSLPKKVLKSWEKGELRYGHLQQLRRLNDKKEILEFYEDILDYWDGPMSVSDLKREIDSRAPRFEYAIFDPEKEGCLSCHKNSDVQKKLFGSDELENAHCLDPICFKKKQNDFLNGHWTETDYHKKYGTNGFRFYENLSYRDYEAFYKGILKQCKGCENFVSLLEEDGRVFHKKVCINVKCFKKTYEKPKNKGSAENGEDPEDTPRVAWHGEYFREKFYETRLPEKFNQLQISADNPDANTIKDRLALFALLKSNDDLHHWFAGKVGIEQDEDRHWFRLSDSEIFGAIEKMDFSQIKEMLECATIETIMQSTFGAPGRRIVADHLGIDLAKEWVVTEEYLKKKTKDEILSIGEKFGIFQDKNAQAFLYEVLNKKRGKFKSCKKSELIRVFLESGADLAGMVPDEILN